MTHFCVWESSAIEICSEFSESVSRDARGALKTGKSFNKKPWKTAKNWEKKLENLEIEKTCARDLAQIYPKL